MCKASSLLLAVVLAFVISISSIGRNVNATDGTETYSITGYNTDNNITDSAGNVLEGHTYCAMYSMDIPNGNEYIRYTLSSYPGTIFDSCPNAHSLTWNNEGKVFSTEDDAEARLLLLNFLIKQDSLDLHGAVRQHIVWDITSGRYCDSFYDDGSTMSDNTADIKSQLMADPFYTFADYDAYYYFSLDQTHQHTIGSVFHRANTALELEKIVIDGEGDPENYNGIDDTLGFTINIHIDDTLGNRPVANENFTFTHTASDGSTSSEVIATDASGDLSLTIMSGETVAITGFDNIYYSFTISESEANTDSTCNLDSMSSSNATLTDNGDGSYTFDFSRSYVVDITITNRHISADPTPIPTSETSETTSEETTTAQVDSTAAVRTESTTTADAQVLGMARAEETTSEEASATPTPTPSPSGTAATGEHTASSSAVTGILLILAGTMIFSVRHVRKQQKI